MEKYSRTEEVDSGAASGGDNFLDTSAAIDFAAVLNVRALDADEDKVRAIPMSSNGPWTKYGASAGGGALEDSGSTALSSALFSQSQTSADIVDIIRDAIQCCREIHICDVTFHNSVLFLGSV